MSMIYPCKDCPDRFPGCHGNCQKYKEAKIDHDVKKGAVRDMVLKDRTFKDFRLEGLAKNMRHRKGVK